jgi:hypothetical protein
MDTTSSYSPLTAGTKVSILPEFRDSPGDAFGWTVIEDRGDRVLIEATGMFPCCAIESPQTLVGREMITAL